MVITRFQEEWCQFMISHPLSPPSLFLMSLLSPLKHHHQNHFGRSKCLWRRQWLVTTVGCVLTSKLVWWSRYECLTSTMGWWRKSKCFDRRKWWKTLLRREDERVVVVWFRPHCIFNFAITIVGNGEKTSLSEKGRWRWLVAGEKSAEKIGEHNWEVTCLCTLQNNTFFL